jgi:signal transduction histidine kinase/ligand-binding sensor domain-containing protein/DNA-binding response OmpR family regulator
VLWRERPATPRPSPDTLSIAKLRFRGGDSTGAPGSARRPVCLIAVALIALVLAAASPSFAEWTTLGRLPLRVFTDRDGLPQNAVTAIAFAEDGALWIGTKDGAARYNGRVWSSVPMPTGMTSNWINDIVKASDGSLWFATRGGGVARLKDGSWSLFTQGQGLPSAEVICLLESSALGAPSMLAGTAEGLARFDGERFATVDLPKAAHSRRVSSLFEAKAQGQFAGLWVGLREDILRFRAGQWTAFDLAAASVPRNNPVRAFAVTTALGGGETLVAAVAHPGLLQFVNGRWKTKALPRPWVGMLQAMLVTRSGAEETLWLAGQARLARIKGGRVQSFAAESGFPAQGFWTLAETPEGGGERALWIGMAGAGLVRLQLNGWTTFDAPRWLTDSSVYGLLESTEPDGRPAIWVGTNRGGLTRMTEKGMTPYTGRNKSGSNTVLSLLETRSTRFGRTLWAGTTGGLGVFRKGRWSPFRLSEDLRGSTIHALLASPVGATDPIVYVGTSGGLGRIERERVRDVTREVGLPDPRVNTLLETLDPKDGLTLWVGTDRGLARRALGVTTVLTAKQGLPSDAVISLVETHELGRRFLWIGTRRGAARLDLQDPAASLTAFDTRSTPALPNDTIYQVRQDRQGRLYLFTNKGIARLTARAATPQEPSGYDIYVFTTEDGLPSAECNTGASMVDSKGRIWAGTIQGAAVLDPVKETLPQPKPLRIERAVISKTGTALRDDASLAHDEAHVTFEFALMNFFRDEDSRFRTQLEGLDAEPSAWTSDVKKEYTSLPAGGYVFNVWGRDVQGVVTGPRRLAFSVRPAPWRTWGAILAYAALLAFLVSIVMRRRLSAVKRRNEELEQVISARTSELGEAVLRLRESEQRALQAKDAALQASRAKSTFLANMSHELRTPLNAVIGFAQVLERRDALRGEDKESLRIIHRSGEHLLSLINDVLSLSKIEAGALALTVKPFDLKGFLESVRSIIKARADAKGLELRFEAGQNLPRAVAGDEGKLRQVLINLLGNAVKFTDKGVVSLRVSAREERIRFVVQDTGAGIAEAEIPKLFTAFAQTESGVRSREGSGLGLAISRQIVQLMGGEIEVRSRPGEGSEFAFEVLLPKTEEAPSGDERRVIGLLPGQGPIRVLVVDDTEENRLLLKQLLTSTGFEVREASNGEQAVERFDEWRPAVIFMDVRMPVMDGLEATRRIRDIEYRGGRMRSVILALTAGAFEHEREEMLHGGADDYVAKPFRVGAIFEKIGQHLGLQYEYEGGEVDAATTPASAADALSDERLRRLKPERRTELYTALAAGHVKRAQAVAERIRVDDESLGSALLLEIQAFRLDELLTRLERTAPDA